MLDMYQCYTPKPTNTYGGQERCASDLSWLVSKSKLIQQYCRSAKGSRHAKTACGHFEHAVWIDVTSINVPCFFTIIKTVSISCNWTDHLLFTCKMALFTSHSHSFVCGRNIIIRFMYLTDIYFAINWWKIQQNMPGHFLEIPVFLGSCFIMPHPVYYQCTMGISIVYRIISSIKTYTLICHM